MGVCVRRSAGRANREFERLNGSTESCDYRILITCGRSLGESELVDERGDMP